MDKETALAQIAAIASTVEGVIGVAAADLEGKIGLTFNAAEVYPTASTIKVPILYEVYRQAELGLLDLNQRVELKAAHFVNGSGVLQDLAVGLNPTIRDLAVLMIVVSDNTATDMLFDIVGVNQVHATMRNLGLEQTTVALTIREIIYSLAGYNVKDPAITYEVVRQRLISARSVDNGQATQEQDNDVSSPLDMVRLLTLIATSQTLKEESCLEMIDIMSRQKYNDIIPLYLPYGTRVAHKTGSIVTVRADVGIVYASPQPYVVALMSKQLTNEVDAVAKLARISEVVYKFFSGADDIQEKSGQEVVE